MVRSLALVLAFVPLIAGAVFLSRPEVVPQPVVDFRAVVAQAEQASDFPLLVPRGLDTWRCTVARFDGSGDTTVWRLAFLTPAEEYVGLEQAGGDPRRFLAERLVGWARDGAADQPAGGWQRWVERDDEPADRALVRVRDGVATVVVTTGDYALAELFAASLAPA